MITAPSYLILMLTDRCNLNCSYCYLGRHIHSINSPQGSDMSLDTIDRIFEFKNIDRNTRHIQITGGEPFPCSQTAYDQDFSLGTLDTHDKADLSSMLESCNLKQILQCNDCDLNLQCPGECPSRLYYNKKSSRDFACTFYQSLASSINPEAVII